MKARYIMGVNVRIITTIFGYCITVQIIYQKKCILKCNKRSHKDSLLCLQQQQCDNSKQPLISWNKKKFDLCQASMKHIKLIVCLVTQTQEGGIRQTAKVPIQEISCFILFSRHILLPKKVGNKILFTF